MTRKHVIGPSAVHHQWDTGLEPLPVIDSGDTVHFDIKVAGDGQVWRRAAFLPGFGLLPDDFPHGHVRTHELKAPLSGGMRFIAEVVDVGVWNVAMTMPQAVFDGDY